MLLRSVFEIEYEKWQLQNHLEEILADVFDREIWKNFTQQGANLFFSKACNHSVTLDLDWFQQLRNSYFIGAIYLVLLNLPYYRLIAEKIQKLAG